MSYIELINDFWDWFNFNYGYYTCPDYYDILDYIDYGLPYFEDQVWAYECLCNKFNRW